MMPVEKAIEAARTLKKQKNPGQPAVADPSARRCTPMNLSGQILRFLRC